MKHRAFVVVGVIMLAIIWIVVYIQEKQCAEKGGERLRAVFGTFTCYDKASLREVK